MLCLADNKRKKGRLILIMVSQFMKHNGSGKKAQKNRAI